MMVYSHVLNKGGRGVQTPADFPDIVHNNAPRVIVQQAQEKQ